MASDPISMPGSSTGLMRYSDVNASAVQISPELVVLFGAGVIVLELLLQFLHVGS